MNLKIASGLSIVLALLAFIGLSDGPRDAALPQTTVDPLPTPVVPADLRSSAPPRLATQSRPSTSPALPVSKPASKADQFDRLVGTGDPVDSLAAYKMIWRCKSVTATNECGDLTPGQRTMAFNLLRKAVEAHVPEAAVHLLDQGPDGRPLGEVWSDVAYADWKQNALQEISAAAARGDLIALRQMAELELIEGRPERALAYWTAYADRQPGNEAMEVATRHYTESVPPEKVAAAVAEGHAMKGDRK